MDIVLWDSSLDYMGTNFGLGKLTLRVAGQLAQEWDILVLLPEIPEKDPHTMPRIFLITEQILWNLMNFISCWNLINFISCQM